MIAKMMLRTSVAALALVSMSAPAFAKDNGALLKRLHEKGILTDEEYADLLAEEQTETAAQPAPAPAPAVQSDPDGLFVKRTPTGIGLEVGPATIKFSGSVNGFYVHDNPDTPSASTAVVGGVANVGPSSTSAVRNGLLPGFLTIGVSTQQEGWDVSAMFGMYPGINSATGGALGANSGGQPTALATSGIDFRQVYLTFGKPKLGTIKIGRDIGLFGSDAILSDITLLSPGTPGGNIAPANTTLGRIGVGYIYTDFQPQITYTSPKFGGAQLAFGVFQPLSSLTAPAQNNKSPGFQGKLSYDGKFGDVSTRLWVSGITQRHNTLGGLNSYTGQGVDVGGKVTFGPLTATGYYYTAKGLGTTVLNYFDTDSSGNPRKSDGFYLQGLATFGKFSIGGSYGESSLHYVDAADALANPTLVATNSSYVGQLRYNLTSWLTLVSEYVHSKAEAHNGNQAESDALALGGILFF